MGETAYTFVPEWPGTFQVSVHATLGLAAVPEGEGAFRFHLLTRGAALLQSGSRRVWAEAPCILCQGSRDRVTVVEENCEVRTVLFHPGTLNDAFYRTDPYDLNLPQGTTRSDQYYLHPFVERPDGLPAILPLGPTQEGRLAALFDRIGGELSGKADGFWPCRSRSWLFEALILVRQEYPFPRAAVPVAAGETTETFVARVQLHLHVHYAEKLTLPGLAALFATNRTTLAARFRAETGQTVGDYLMALRIRVAGVLLRDTGIPVQEVMFRSGFTDPSHFGRIFRRQAGLSPSEYRTKNSWMLASAS